MDTVILAAGKGERLDGVMAPYHKPLMVINGRPIVQQAVDFGLQLGGHVIVVVAPENAAPISHVLGDRPVHMVVQRRANGPGYALATGLMLAEGKVMVLMGDNVSTFADVMRVADAQSYGVGVQLVDREDAIRFTYWRHGDQTWAEKIRPAQPDLDPSGMVLAWVGPLTVDRDTALEYYRDSQEHDARGDAIGPAIPCLVPNGKSHTAVSVGTYDIGVPEALA